MIKGFSGIASLPCNMSILPGMAVGRTKCSEVAMSGRINLISRIAIGDIDGAEATLSANADGADLTAERVYSSELIGDGYSRDLHCILKDIEALSDFELVRRLRKKYVVTSFDNTTYSRPRCFVTKINHGFWEHLSYIFTDSQFRGAYRDVNLPLRERQYLTSDFIPALLGAWKRSLRSHLVDTFISTTTGAYSIPHILGTPWVLAECDTNDTYSMAPYVRGAVKGLIAFSELVSKDQPITVHDSFQINSDFENTSLLRHLKSTANENTACVVVGPPHLSRVRVVGWPGVQFFLAISASSAMAQWRFNLKNMYAVVDYLASERKDVVILFQGAVLGPVFAEHLSVYASERNISVRFVDLGRILDMAYEEDLSKTGSPLPSRTFTSVGQFELGDPAEFIFQKAAHP